MRRLGSARGPGLWLLGALVLFVSRPANADPATGGQAESEATPPPGSVYRVNLAVDATVIGLGILGTAIPYAFASSIIDIQCPCDPSKVNSLDRRVIGYSADWAWMLADATVAVAIAAPLAVSVLDVGFSQALFEDTVVYAEALTTTLALVSISKHVFQRPFPRTYAGDPELVGSPDGYRSFWSGHTAVTFSSLSAAVVTQGLRHDRYLLPSILTLVVGASIGAELIAGASHFYTDVFAGALAGTAVGTAIPLLHARPGDLRLTVGITPDGGPKLQAIGRF